MVCQSRLTQVYNTSVLGTIPPSVSDLLVQEPSRLQPLFCVGVHDIPFLERLSRRRSDGASTILPESMDSLAEQGWVACTTDAVLALKPHLYDILITLPHHGTLPQSLLSQISSLRLPVSDQHPIMTSSAGELLKPTLHDYRRWKRLRGGGIPSSTVLLSDPDFEDVTYARTWTEFICSGLCWWATAGESSFDDFDYDSDGDEYLLSEP